ncbi:MAG: murein L,D-transpeptidase [Phycisphaerae bacterium]|nr:murein L,D-transpeptidase [Phycisphaerae bacterium]
MSLAEAVALQAALDRAGFSPGIIDGLIGSKTMMGLKAFQSVNGLPATGELDKETRTALRFDVEPATTPYRLTADDVAQVGECPADWIAKSRATRLGFDSLLCVAAYHGHCSRKLVERLNVGKDVKSLKAGDIVIIPNVKRTKPASMAARVEVHFEDKIVRAFDSANRLVGLFHCSIARETKDRPAGICKVATITKNPIYTFKPESWPEVKGIDRNLEIPPGPRNPVGLCWIGLDKKGYGIHGTPEPELIGKTGSHGCIRLTNWDVLRLAEFVSVGTEVRFVDRGERTVAQAN